MRKLCPFLCPTQLENHGISSQWGTVDLADASPQRVDNIATYHFIADFVSMASMAVNRRVVGSSPT